MEQRQLRLSMLSWNDTSFLLGEVSISNVYVFCDRILEGYLITSRFVHFFCFFFFLKLKTFQASVVSKDVCKDITRKIKTRRVV